MLLSLLSHFTTLRWCLHIIIIVIIIIIISDVKMKTETKQVVWRPLFVKRKTSHVDLAATTKLRGWIPSNSAFVVHHSQISVIHRRDVVIDTAIQSQHTHLRLKTYLVHKSFSPYLRNNSHITHTLLRHMTLKCRYLEPMLSALQLCGTSWNFSLFELQIHTRRTDVVQCIMRPRSWRGI